MNKSSNDGCGPCGACKFLRRKCVKGCIFAPYFSSEQGASHFAAVHKVFGASNVSKLLLRLPVHERLDASLTICYEAMARMKDPVYGCVGYILALQQQVENLQAELAFIQAHLSTLELSQVPVSPTNQSLGCASFHVFSDNSLPASGVSAFLDPMQVQEVFGMANYRNQTVQDNNNGDLSALAQEFVSKYLPCGRFQPPDS